MLYVLSDLMAWRLVGVGNRLLSITLVIVRLVSVRPKYMLLSLTLSLAIFSFYNAAYPFIVPAIITLIYSAVNGFPFCFLLIYSL